MPGSSHAKRSHAKHSSGAVGVGFHSGGDAHRLWRGGQLAILKRISQGRLSEMAGPLTEDIDIGLLGINPDLWSAHQAGIEAQFVDMRLPSLPVDPTNKVFGPEGSFALGYPQKPVPDG